MSMGLNHVLTSLALLLIPAVGVAEIEIKKTDQSLLEINALLLGGIGLFLTGIHFAGSHLHKLTGGLFTRFFNQFTRSVVGSSSIGMTLGFLTQSGKACAFIVADFVQARVIDTRQALHIVSFGNAGASLIALVSILNIKVFGLILLGITGLGLTFRIPKRLVSAYGAMFGLGMIIFGLYLIKDGAGALAGREWMSYILNDVNDYFFLSFLFGFILTLLFQSNIATYLVIIAFAASGVMPVQEGFIALLGAQASTGIMSYVYSFHSKGRARQVVIQQIVFDFLVTLFFLLLFIFEVGFGATLLLQGSALIFGDAGQQMLALVIATQLIGALLFSFMNSPVIQWIERYFEPTSVEILSATEFISEDTHSPATSVETNLLLVEKEQMRLMRRLPNYIEYIRQGNIGASTDKNHTPNEYHEAYHLISTKIAQTLSAASSNRLSDIEAGKLMTRTKLQEQLDQLEGIVFEFTRTLQHGKLNPYAIKLGKHVMESLDFLIMTAIDTLESNDADDLYTLAVLTKDRSEMMMKIRQEYLKYEQSLDQSDRNFILDVTILLENAVQALSRYAVLLQAFEQVRPANK